MNAIAFELLADKAELSATHAERWQAEHEAAMDAWVVSDLCDEAKRLFQRWVQLDDDALPSPSAEMVRSRERGLRGLLRLVTTLKGLCPDAVEYGHPVSSQQLDQIAGHVELMLRGVKVYDSDAERRALDEVAAGKSVSLDELRRRLRDRRS